MKKVIALMMVVLMVCALTGCSMDEDTKEHFLSLDTKPNDTGNESSETTQNQLPTELKFEYYHLCLDTDRAKGRCCRTFG